MADLPRLVRVAAEVGWRGQTSLALVGLVVAYWVLASVLDQPLRLGETLLVAIAAALLTAGIAGLSSARRVREALERSLRPRPAMLYETAADGRDRRARVMLLVAFAVAALLVVDRVVEGGGLIAGLVSGLMLVLGGVDLIEARRWQRIERELNVRLYLLIPPNAMAGRYGRIEVYEVPRERSATDRPPAMRNGAGRERDG